MTLKERLNIPLTIKFLSNTHGKLIYNKKRRVHNLFETANIKIDSIVSDLFGVTGRNLISLFLKLTNTQIQCIKIN
ncbi:hypothetical protein SAMN04487931_11356 [Desulfobacula phenolica]|uniref:Uncharacterized protein n=1 Tax=Desulfobacula phenolica TaxID=90732 RepID=A0A1H2JLI7_9BACT|nr:hypothetical protein SAMN04487931_11356 [Desulfobacula phenolica]